jgi:hypothetical protein
MRKKLLVAGALVLATLLVGAPSAQAASGTTQVSISYPPMIILYYYTLVPVTLAASDLGSLFNVGSGDYASATASAGAGTNSVSGTNIDVTPGTALTTTLTPAANAVGLVLMTNWTVRSVGNATNNTQVAVALTGNTTLTGSNGGTITVSGVGTRQSGGTTFSANTSFAPTGLGGSQSGDVQLTLNLTNASRTGSYINATGGQYTITATNL